MESPFPRTAKETSATVPLAARSGCQWLGSFRVSGKVHRLVVRIVGIRPGTSEVPELIRPISMAQCDLGSRGGVPHAGRIARVGGS